MPADGSVDAPALDGPMAGTATVAEETAAGPSAAAFNDTPPTLTVGATAEASDGRIGGVGPDSAVEPPRTAAAVIGEPGSLLATISAPCTMPFTPAASTWLKGTRAGVGVGRGALSTRTMSGRAALTMRASISGLLVGGRGSWAAHGVGTGSPPRRAASSA